jgi:hypothetical protein
VPWSEAAACLQVGDRRLEFGDVVLGFLQLDLGVVGNRPRGVRGGTRVGESLLCRREVVGGRGDG